MLIKEKRSVGHVGPGLDTVAKLIMKLQPIAASEQADRRSGSKGSGKTDARSCPT